MRKSNIIVLVSCHLLWGISFAQEFTKEQMLEDLAFLKSGVEEYNPGLELFTPSFSQEADSLLSTVNNGGSRYDLYKKVSQLAALSSEGHFKIGNSTDTVHYGLVKDKVPFFPFVVAVLEDELFIYYNFSEDDSLTKGDQILSINGKPAKDIITEMITCIPTDGDIPTYPRARLLQRFPWLYHTVIEQARLYTIRVKDQEGRAYRDVNVNALTASERFNYYKIRYPQNSGEASINDFYELKYEGSTAILELKSFDWKLVEKYKLEADEFYEQVFSEIEDKGSEKLIVDLRNNTGGRNAFASEIIPFIRKEGVDHEYLSKSISWKGKKKTEKAGKRSKVAFQGEITVLVNGLSYSNGSVLARYLREWGNAKVIGEETGTRYEGFVAGSQEMITLPHSKLEIGIPRYAKVYPASAKQTTSDRGLIPDIVIPLTIEMLLTEEDEIMNYALGL